MRACSLLFLTLVLALISGCASSPNPDTQAVTLDVLREDKETRAISHADVKTLYKTARRFLESGDATSALKLYDEIQTRFPFSEYATQAALESVYAYYLSGQYISAISAANRFIKQHPRHPDIAYVYYIRGLANVHRTGDQLSILSMGRNLRDMTHLRQAFTNFNILIRKYPDSPYAKDAQLRMVKIKNRLAKHEIAVAEYYLMRGAWVAASRRAEYVVNYYQRTNSVQRALEIMIHSYQKLGLDNLAMATRAILQTSYPRYLVHREEFYRQRAGLEPRYELPPLDTGPPPQLASRGSQAAQPGQ